MQIKLQAILSDINSDSIKRSTLSLTNATYDVLLALAGFILEGVLSAEQYRTLPAAICQVIVEYPDRVRMLMEYSHLTFEQIQQLGAIRLSHLVTHYHDVVIFMLYNISFANMIALAEDKLATVFAHIDTVCMLMSHETPFARVLALEESKLATLLIHKKVVGALLDHKVPLADALATA